MLIFYEIKVMLCKRKRFRNSTETAYVYFVGRFAIMYCIVYTSKRNAHSLSKLAKCRIKLFLNEDIQNRKKEY